MKKIFRLTESQLVDIIKKTIKEQTKGFNSDKPMFVLPELKGKTINLYSDKTNKNFRFKGVINNVLQVQEFPETKISIDFTLIFHNQGTQNQQNIKDNFTFECSYDDVLIGNKNKEGIPGTYYNKNLTDLLKQKFCTKSRGGADVPKADFAKTQTSSGSMS